MLFRRRNRVDKHTTTVFLDIPTLGWTILRAADAAMTGGKGRVSTQYGYRTVEYFSDHAIQVSDIDESVIFTFGAYQTVFLTVVEPNHRHHTLSHELGAYDDELAQYERKLVVAVDRMRDIDLAPEVFARLTCGKRGEFCGKDVEWSESHGAHVCPTHGALKRREVNTTDIDPFQGVPSLYR